MRRLVMLALCLASLAACSTTPGQGDQQSMVDRAALTVQDMLGGGNDALNAASLLRRARGALICPQIFRGGFFFVGGEGGGCVLVGRDAAGGWSSPAFYGLGSASFGFQMGIQDAQVLLLVMNDRALNALLDSQFKFGADAALTVATYGGGVQGAVTGAVGADIVAFARSRGLYGGITLEGSLLSSRSDWNRGYYGRDVSGRDIVRSIAVHNPGADPLRAVLMRFGGGNTAAAPTQTYQPSQAQQPVYSGPPPVAGGQTPVTGGVQATPLPPLR